MLMPKIKKIIIVGGGTAGFMTASSLINSYGNSGINITLIESSKIKTIGVGEATIPTIRSFYHQLGISDQEVIAKTGATAKLGIQFNGWKNKDSSFVHPFGGFGHDFNNIGFWHYLNAYEPQILDGGLDNLALGSALAKAGKFAIPDPIKDTTPIYARFDWALHIDALLFANFLKDYSLAKGLNYIDAKIEKVEINENNGFIKSLLLDDGKVVEADLFIDCSGFEAILIGKTLGNKFESYEKHLLTNAAWAMPSKRIENPIALTKVTAHSAGWQWQIPLNHRTGNGHVFARDFMNDELALQILESNLPSEKHEDARLIKFTPGRRNPWDKNCIAIGLSSGFLEPLESTAIALIQNGIERIKMFFPFDGIDEKVIKEHNRIAQKEFERVRDFIILHYKLNQRGDSEFWRYVAQMDIPDTLSEKIELYKRRGHFVRYSWEMFHHISWLAMYSGFGVLPQNHELLVENMGQGNFRNALNQINLDIERIVARAPLHSQFINHCNKVAS